MQLSKSILLSIALASQVSLGAYIPSEPWSTLTPDASYPSGAVTDYASSFGIAISTVGTGSAALAAASSTAALNKRDNIYLVKKDVASQVTDGQVQATTGTSKTTKAAATQITDGQVQATTGKTTKAAATQITDGQVQATTGKTTKAAATQITDGQVQATTGKTTKAAATQITDGQVQATTGKTTEVAATQITDGQVQATTGTAKTTKAAVSQITDGQVQATTGKTTKAAVSQITDGQVQATTGKTTEAAVSQITDGQVQATTGKTTKAAASQITDGQVQATTGSTTVKSGATQITDGQIQAATASSSSEGSDGQVTDTDGDDVADPVTAVSCYSDDTLLMTLNNSILTDSKGRIGSIVANRQFQFDGPPPQAGAIYAAGWSITSEGNLAIGNSSSFYECLSGNFYNLYDEDIGSVCYEVVLQVVDLVDC